jgi:hypothetical protein
VPREGVVGVLKDALSAEREIEQNTAKFVGAWSSTSRQQASEHPLQAPAYAVVIV